MADTAHSIAHRTDPPIISNAMARWALCGHRTKALHGLTLEMVRVVTAALNELVINPAIGHVGLKGESSHCGSAATPAHESGCKRYGVAARIAP